MSAGTYTIRYLPGLPGTWADRADDVLVWKRDRTREQIDDLVAHLNRAHTRPFFYARLEEAGVR